MPPDLATLIGVLGSGGAIALGLLLRKRRPLLHSWRRIANEFGLSFDPERDPIIDGHVNGLSVKVSAVSGEKFYSAKVIVDGKKRIAERLVLQPTHVGLSIEGNIGRDYFIARGDQPAALALFALRPDAMEAVGQLISAHRANVHSGQVFIELKSRSALRLRRAIRAGLQIARATQLDKRQIVARLARGVQRPELDIDLRLSCLEALMLEHPNAPETQAALREAERAAEPQLRLGAVKLHRPPQPEQIRRLFESPMPIPLKIQLIGMVCIYLSRAEATERIRPLLHDESIEVREVALERLTRLNAPNLEPDLIALLELDAPGLRRAVVNWLGRWGTVAAVNPLLESAKRIFINAELKMLTKSAVNRIQSRLIDGDTGQLSVIDPSAGELSISADQSGAMSILDAKAPPKRR